MNSAEMMKRCENALRTGQTENLFPVLAKRTLQLIRQDRDKNRRQWSRLGPREAAQVMAIQLREAGKAMEESFAPAMRAAATVYNEAADSINRFSEALSEVFGGTRR